MPWTLDNAEERAAEAPRSFFIPPAETRRNLQVGDVVKLIFRLESDDSVQVERMWVEVVETEPYVGTLANNPDLEGVIEHGERVPFGPEHVCGYGYAAEDLGYDPGERCFVSKRLIEADTPPALMYLNREGVWEAHAADESDEEVDDPDRVLHWSLGYLTDKFPLTEQVVREGARRSGLLRRRPRDVWWRLEDDRYVRA